MLEAQALRHFDAIEPRQPEIQDHQVGQERLRLVQGTDAVRGDFHVVALQPERALEDLRDRIIVFDDQYSGGAFEISHGL